MLRSPRLPLWFLLFCLPAAASRTTRVTVAPGVEMTQIVIAATETGGPELIHVLSVKPSQRGVRIEASLGGGTVEEPGGGMEAVNRQVLRTGALAGINADFFPYTGDPLGIEIHGGELVSEPVSERGAFGITRRGKVIIGRPTFKAEVKAEDGAVVVLNGVNRKPTDGELVLFAPIYGDKTPNKAATLAVLEASKTSSRAGATLKAKVLTLTDETGAVAVPAKGLVLSGTGAAAEWLKAHAVAGKELQIRTEVMEEGKDWTSVQEAVGGGPVLLLNGKEDIQVAREHMALSFSTARHPRSALAVKGDGTVLILAVDGRQALSRGMSLPELAATLKDLGAVDAVNLDGGGSTCLSVRGLVINCPSDGQVRQTANTLLVFDDALKIASGGKLAAATDEAADLPSDGSRVELAAPDDAKDVIWGTLNGGAFVGQDGGLYGYKPGRAAVAAVDGSGKVLLTHSYKVLPGPAGKMLLAWTSGTLRITIRDVNNNPVKGQEITLAKPDGTKTEVATGADGVADVPKGWLTDEKDAVTLVSGVLTRTWPDQAP